MLAFDHKGLLLFKITGFMDCMVIAKNVKIPMPSKVDYLQFNESSGLEGNCVTARFEHMLRISRIIVIRLISFK